MESSESNRKFKISLQSVPDERAALPNLRSRYNAAVEIGAATIKKNLTEFISDFLHILEELPQNESFDVKNVQINTSIGADGGIELIGKFSSSFQAGIIITFEKRPEK